MSSTQEQSRQSTRERLINHAMQQCHERRAEVNQCRMLYDGHVPRQVLLRFQASILEFYWAMRPLRDDDNVHDFWDSVTLSESWTRPVRTVNVDGDLHGQGVDISEQDEQVPYEGLDTLEWLEDQTETVELEKNTMRGKRSGTKTRQLVLDPAQLVDISGALDDAADKLGLTVETPQKTPVYGYIEVDDDE